MVFPALGWSHIFQIRKLVNNLICTHCGKTLENESQLFCAYCGYPVGDKKSFFARTEETGELPADESAGQSMMAQAQPVPQPSMLQGAQMSMPMGMMGMMPQMSMMQGMMPQMGMMQGMMPYTGMMQGMMPNVMNQMSNVQGQKSDKSDSEQPENPQPVQQQMLQNPMRMGVGGMAQMMGYDANGNPIYIQMMPQVMGYDPYGNPIYAMIPVMQPMQNNAQQGQSDESAPEAQKAASVSVQGRAISQPKKKNPVPSIAEEHPEPEHAQQPKENENTSQFIKPEKQETPEKAQTANARKVGQPIQEGFFARQVKLQNPVANGVGIRPAERTHPQPKPEPVQEQPEPAEEMPVSADILMMGDETQPENLPDEKELLDSIFSDRPKKYTMTEGVEPSAKTFSISLSASEVTSVRRRNSGVVPDTLEKVPSTPKEQSHEERIFSEAEEVLPPPMAMYDKPPQKDPSEYSRSRSRHQPFQPQNNSTSWQYQQQAQSYPQQGAGSQYQQSQPYPQQGMNSQYQQSQPYHQHGTNSQYQQAQPYPQQGSSYQSQPYPQQGNSYQYQQPSNNQQPPYPQQSNSYQYQQAYSSQGAPQQSQYFQSQVTAKQPTLPDPAEKIRPSKVERPMPKAEKPQHKSSGSGKKPAKIVDAAEFFGDKPVKSRGELGVTMVDNMTDEQLAAQLAQMQFGGKKKSRRSMKAATELEADFSNIPSDMLPSDS